ncbi:MAG TPA: hypothetical protein VJR89_39955, partial [Polyangiales bacterium]|nr:hypothetical protein [Polyangiales bacterium]
MREHVEEELEDDTPKKKEKKPEKKKQSGHGHGHGHEETEIDIEPDEPAAADSGPQLPFRILGDDVRIDLQVGAGYRGWLPQQYPQVHVAAGSYWIWNVEVKAKLFRFLNLRRGYYESNGLSGPRTEEAAVAAQIGSYVPKAAWLLGVFGFPFFKIWEPIIRYETRAFHTEAAPKRAVCIVTAEVADDVSR